jgi:hypothetical protein
MVGAVIMSEGIIPKTSGYRLVASGWFLKDLLLFTIPAATSTGNPAELG